MGKVYRATHRFLGYKRAIKILRPEYAQHEEIVERFKFEAIRATKINHSNVVKVFNFGFDQDGSGVPFLVMEFIDGVSLLEVLERHDPRSVALTTEFAVQSLRGLARLHATNIVHRDISPQNLMLTRSESGEPMIKVIDLGIAKAREPEESGPGRTVAGTFLGKPAYAAPEQFTFDPVSARTDLYSFAVTFYELYTGRLPFPGRDFTKEHLVDQPLDFAVSDRKGRLPRELRAVLLRGLEKLPERRFGNADEFRKSLQPFLDPARGCEQELSQILGPWGSAVEPVAPPPPVAPEPEPAERDGGTLIEPLTDTVREPRILPETQLEPEPLPQPDTVPETQPEPEPWPKPEPRTLPETQPEPEPEAEWETEELLDSTAAIRSVCDKGHGMPADKLFCPTSGCGRPRDDVDYRPLCRGVVKGWYGSHYCGFHRNLDDPRQKFCMRCGTRLKDSF